MEWDFIFNGEADKPDTCFCVHGKEQDIRNLWNMMAKQYHNSYFIVVDHKGNIRNQ